MAMPVGVGLIGLGMAARPHMLALQDLVAQGRVKLIGGFSPSHRRRQDFESSWSIPVFESQETFLSQSGLGLVLILTPPGTHLPIAAAVATAGHAMIVEKPLEISAERGEALAALVEQRGVTCGVCLQHRYRPGALRLRYAITNGEIGDLLSASASIRWWRDEAYFAQSGRGMKARDGGGVLLTQAIHSIDLLLHLIGPHKSVIGFAKTSSLRRIDTEDVVAAAISFENGAIGVLDATTVARPGYPERIEIAGTKGSAVLEGSHLRLTTVAGTETIGAASHGGGADPMAFDHEPHRALIADVLDAMHDGRSPVCSARSALGVQHLIEDLLRDAKRHS